MAVTNNVVNRVSLTKAELIEALKDYIFKNSVIGDSENPKEIHLVAVTDFDATADDYVLVNLVLDVDP